MFSFQPSLQNSWASKVLLLLVLCVYSVMLSSCDLAKNYQKPDRGSNMEMQDYRDGLAERLPEVDERDSKNKSRASIPSLQPYVSSKANSLKPMPLVSVNINQTVPVRDILYQLAKDADYDLELDPRIRGTIIFTARNKPFDVVIDRIANVAGLRYEFGDGFLRVELDKPYNKTYKIDYLSYIRSNSSSVGTSVSVVTGEGAEAGSQFQSKSESVSDFWSELALNLEQMLGGGSTGAMRTDADPRITAVDENPDVQAVAPQQTGENGEQVTVQPPEAVLRVEALPVEGEEGEMEEEDQEFTYSINKQGGIVSVYANEKTHEEVKAYLELLRRSVTAQVLVEAKIFEVNLNDEYITGIDWNVIGLSRGEGFMGYLNQAGATTVNAMLAAPGVSQFSAPVGSQLGLNSNVTVGYAGNDVQALVQAISGFGTVRALASPRLTVLNNQSAVLNVATNRVFFEIDVDSTDTDDDGDVDTIEVDTEVKSVPEGVLVNVQPSINLENRTISLSLRPTVTRVVGTVNDPGVAFVASSIAGAANLVSAIPEVNVQEIDTVVQVHSGQPIVMGGLLQDRASNDMEGVPVLGEVPVVGALFRKKNDFIQKTELVIFLKATLIEAPEQTIHNTDRDLYKMFSGDRRPFKL